MALHPVDGVLVADKQAGCTSHDVVLRARRKLSCPRVGHLGTLDPIATGCLPLCVGRATRLSPFFSGSPKVYRGVLRLGLETDTYDSEGAPTAPPRDVTLEKDALAEAAARFVGDTAQTPPMYSAKKVAGAPLYKLARKGGSVERAPVTVRIFRFDILDVQGQDAAFEVECGPGTYVRSLVHDLGRLLGCGAVVAALRRLRSGAFSLDQAVVVEQASIDRLFEALVPLRALLPELEAVPLAAEQVCSVRNGRAIPVPDLCRAEMGAMVRLLSEDGGLLALGRVMPEALLGGPGIHPKVVLG